MRSRRSHTRIHARVLGAALAATLGIAAPASAQSGGAPTPDQQAGAAPVDPEFVISSRRAVMVGNTLRVKGSAPRAAGRSIRIDVLDPSGLWLPVTASEAAGDGSFTAVWSPTRAGRFMVRAVAATSGEARGSSAGRSSVPRPFTAYRPAVASWYGPGFFGRRTACGERLTRRKLGVAHRRLPCGTRVALMNGRRTVVVRVIDRGPFVGGVHYDLTEATARRLGVAQTAPIGVAPLRQAR